jgi:Uma2 family endonuclease
MSPSYNHSYLAYRVAKLLDKGERFNIHIEMTLDIEGCDYIPDIVFYERNKIDFLHDKIKSEEKPLLIIEILSPKQSVNEITDKFEIYLNFGIKSCWLIIPPTKTVIICNDINYPLSYSMGIAKDEILGVEIVIEELFN